jgi:hypothetical protein
MRLLLDRYEFLVSLSAAVPIALGGGVCTWLAFHLWRRPHPLLCTASMGLFTGVAGAGAFLLSIHLLTALSP